MKKLFNFEEQSSEESTDSVIYISSDSERKYQALGIQIGPRTPKPLLIE